MSAVGGPERQVRLFLDLVSGSDPIVGQVSAAGDEPQPFAGWIELTAALEEARARSDGTTTTAEGSGGPA